MDQMKSMISLRISPSLSFITDTLIRTDKAVVRINEQRHSQDDVAPEANTQLPEAQAGRRRREAQLQLPSPELRSKSTTSTFAWAN